MLAGGWGSVGRSFNRAPGGTAFPVRVSSAAPPHRVLLHARLPSCSQWRASAACFYGDTSGKQLAVGRARTAPHGERRELRRLSSSSRPPERIVVVKTLRPSTMTRPRFSAAGRGDASTTTATTAESASDAVNTTSSRRRNFPVHLRDQPQSFARARIAVTPKPTLRTTCRRLRHSSYL